MIKTLYAKGRKRDLSREEFVRLWRGHGSLAMMQPGFWDPLTLYIQSDPLVDVTGFTGVTSRFDGIGELHFSSVDARERSRASRERREITVPDSDRMFDPTGAIYLALEEKVVCEGRLGAVKIYLFVHRNLRLDRKAFFPEWEKLQASIFGSDPLLKSVTRELVSSRSIDETSAIDGCLEVNLDTVPVAREAYAAWLDAMLASGSTLVDAARTIVVPARTCLLYDRRHFG